MAWQKCRVKYLSKLFCLKGFSLKRHLQWAFNDYVSVIRGFINQIFRAAEKAPLTWFPPAVRVQGVR
jgi:hypothetical protein